jgi:hypothetical protein
MGTPAVPVAIEPKSITPAHTARRWHSTDFRTTEIQAAAEPRFAYSHALNVLLGSPAGTTTNGSSLKLV